MITTCMVGFHPEPSCDWRPFGLCCDPDMVRSHSMRLYTKCIQRRSKKNTPSVHHTDAGNLYAFARVTALPYDVYRKSWNGFTCTLPKSEVPLHSTCILSEQRYSQTIRVHLLRGKPILFCAWYGVHKTDARFAWHFESIQDLILDTL